MLAPASDGQTPEPAAVEHQRFPAGFSPQGGAFRRRPVLPVPLRPSGLYSSHPLQRRWRDVRCVSQHVAGNNSRPPTASPAATCTRGWPRRGTRSRA
ncbi:hypothetical protein [Streptomyces iakyrus]|uniref:hypothetical protein n=1 Tax=Streptomyces iakyrus TaxID=68219 RepID=UPI0036F9A170